MPFKSRSWVIYTLHDPREPHEVRYVGKTHQKPCDRWRRHLQVAKSGCDKTHCGYWKRFLLSSGVEPVFTVVETGTDNGWNDAEVRWVAHYRGMGDRLTNHTDGGGGIIGMSHTSIAKARIGEAQKKAWADPQKREQRCAALKTARDDPQTQERQRTASKVAQNLPETKAKQKEAQKKSWEDSDIKARRIKRMKEALSAPEVKDKMRNSLKGVWADPEARARRITALKAGWARKRAVSGETDQPIL